MSVVRSDGNGGYIGKDNDGNDIAFHESLNGSYKRTRDSDGYDVIQDSDGNHIADVESNDE